MGIETPVAESVPGIRCVWAGQEPAISTFSGLPCTKAVFDLTQGIFHRPATV